MEGITTACLLFVFVCLILPSIIQNKNQYYVAFLSLIGVMIFDTIAHMMPESAGAPRAVCYVLAAIGQIIAVVMLFLATGGLTFRALQGDMIEVLRRGEQEKEVIIPLSDEAKQKIRANQEAAARRTRQDEDEPQVFKIDDPITPQPTPAAPIPRPPASSDPLPLE